uniref:Uncharacterized protein n=1 Tax=Panagrolaimus sp. PS1159 TaxID=55785 RepID=A0AC35FH40_9BILA
MKLVLNFLLIFLISTNITTTNTLVLQATDLYVHKVLATSNLTKYSEFSFTFSKAPNCDVTKPFEFHFSLSSATPKRLSTKKESSEIFEALTKTAAASSPDWKLLAKKEEGTKTKEELPLFSFNVFDIRVTPPLNVEDGMIFALTIPSDLAFQQDQGKLFKVTLKSKDFIEFMTDGRPMKPSRIQIPYDLKFDKINPTHLGVFFYVWFDQPINDVGNCTFNFDFPDYVEYKGESFLPTTPKPLSTKKDSPVIITTTAKTTAASTAEKKEEETQTSSTVIYVTIFVGTLLIGMLICGVASYFLLPKLSFFKPSSAENDVTKIDAEISKVSTIQSVMPDQDEKPTNTTINTTVTKATKEQTLNGIPNIESFDGRIAPNAL